MNGIDNTEDFDIEEEIRDIEGFIDSITDFVGDLGLSLKAGLKGRMKSIKNYHILHKRNQDKLKQVLTRYDLEKISKIGVTSNLREFIIKELSLASDLDILDKFLNLNVDDYNLELLDILTTNKPDKLLSKINSGNNTLDGIAKNIITSGVLDIDKDALDRFTSGKDGFVLSYAYGSSVKGVVIDNENSIMYYKTFRYDKDNVTPQVIPVSSFNTIKDNYLSDGDKDVKVALNIYKRTIKDIGKFLRNMEKDDGMTVGNAKVITHTAMFHIDNITDSMFKQSSLQYDFLRVCLDALKDAGVGYAVKSGL